jgi:glutathione S-transferase
MHLLIANKLYSSWSLRPWLLMRVLGIPFSEDVIPLRQADTAVRIAKHGPTGKVPVLVDGDINIWESLAIVEYLAEKFPDKGVWPRDVKARAHGRAVSNEMHAGFQPLRAGCPMNLGKRFALKDYGPEVKANVARLETLWREARAKFGSKAATSSGGGPFLYGAFSAADAMYGPVVTRLDSYQLPVAADTRAYMDAVLALPAFQEWRLAALAEPVSWDIADYEAGHNPVEDFRKS